MKKRNFSAEFKRESAQLVVDQNYTVADAAKAMDVGLSTMTRWVVDSIGQRNSYVKTWGCGGFLNETNIYSRGKSLCF